jgi:hypothetical protein
MTATSAAPTGTVGDIVLVRFALPGKKPPTPSAVRKDVGKLISGHDLTVEEFATLRDELVAKGMLAPGTRESVHLTEAGRRRALAVLGINDLAPRTTWKVVLTKHLFSQASGLSADAVERLKSADKLAAFLLKRKYDLPTTLGDSLQTAMEALVCHNLGFPEEATLNGLVCAVLSKVIGADEKLTMAALKTQLPRIVAGTNDSKPDTLRSRLIRDWLISPSTVVQALPEPTTEFDLPAFAEAVKALARTSPASDRFHDNKVFIAAIWRASQREYGFPRMSLLEFKTRLVEANRASLLRLSRADLVQAMDPARVAESETQFLNAIFHFVLLEGDRP